MAKNKIVDDFENQMKPYLDICIEKLLKGLESKEIIHAKKDQNSHKIDIETTNEGIIKMTQHHVFNDLFEFASIVRLVYSNLGLSDSSNANLKLMEIIDRLEKTKAISVPWKNKKEVIDLMNDMGELNSTDEQYLKSVQRIIDENDINFKVVNAKLLEFYGVRTATEYFTNFGYTEINKAQLLIDKFDFEMESQNGRYPELLFDFSYLKNAILPTKNSLLKSIKSFSLVNANGNENLYYFLIVFTGKQKEEFKRARFEFSQIIKDFPEYDLLRDRISFLPVSINSLQLINDDYEEFKNNFIERNIQINFNDKRPPPHRPERNDHIYEEIFDLTKSDIEIEINPTSAAPFWRFGIRYSESEKFPSITEARYSDKNIVVTEVCVGQRENSIWAHSNGLWLQSTNSGDIVTEGSDLVSGNYKGEKVRLFIQRRNAAQIYFELTINNDEFRKKLFNTRLNNYCQLAAWADYTTFLLPTDVKLIHKG